MRNECVSFTLSSLKPTISVFLFRKMDKGVYFKENYSLATVTQEVCKSA